MKKFFLNHLTIGLAASALFVATPLMAMTLSQSDSEKLSGGSYALAFAPPMGVASGSGLILEGGSGLVVAAVRKLPQGTELVFENSSAGFRQVFALTGQGLTAMGKWIGKSIVAIATASGTIIASGEEVLAFIPNEAAKHIFHTADYGPPR